MSSPVRRLWQLLLLGLLIASAVWVAWDNWGRFGVTPPATATPTTANHAQTLARGQYLAHIGGCIACHTATGSEPLAGGRRIATPFGDVFSSNLTVSAEHGLGQWSLKDFENAMQWGRSRNGRLLLPAFPYNHTSALTSSDVQALFAWLQTVPPIEQAQPAHRITWPLGTQPAIALWRSMFFSPATFSTNPAQSDAWNRGAYLVQTVGHCAACHGKRNAWGSFPATNDLSGGYLSPHMWVAPNLTDPTQTTIGQSSVEELAKLLRTGHNSQAQVTGPMAEFVQLSSQHLTETDAKSMAIYLKSQVVSPTEMAAAAHRAETSPQGQTIYTTHCAGCHGPQGQGHPGQYPALANNPAVTLSQPENLIQAVLYGGYGPSTHERPRPYGMPPYLFTLNNQQIAHVLNHIRSQWGNQASAVTPVQVDKVRAASY